MAKDSNKSKNPKEKVVKSKNTKKSLKIKALFLKYMELMTVVKIRLKIKY